LEIAQHQHGNYAITMAIITWGNNACKPIYQRIAENLPQLFAHKNSCTVIEKAIENSDHEHQVLLIESMSKQGVMKAIMKQPDSFFALRKLFNKLVDSEQDAQTLRNKIEENLSYINDRGIKARFAGLLLPETTN
jgi:hypothetical protein